MNLIQGLQRTLQQKPNATATVCGDRRRTFKELGERVARFAAALQTLDIGPGDRVAMLAQTSDYYLEYYLATFWAGATVNPVNSRWSPAEVAYSLDDCGTGLLIVDSTYAHLVSELRAQSKAPRTIVFAGEGEVPEGMLSLEQLIANTAPIESVAREGHDVAGVFYTGGTTGFPKGVMLSHSNLYNNAFGMLAEGLTVDGSIGLHVLPLFHAAGVMFLMTVLLRGGSHVFLPTFSPYAILEVIARERVTDLGLVPTMLQMLIEDPQAQQYDLSSLRTFMYGASPINETVLDKALALMPNVAFLQSYGMTELSPVATVLPPWYHTPEGRKAGKLRSAGRSTYAMHVRIVDNDGNEVPRGTVGEVAVRGAGVMLGYWNKPAETAAAIRNGWMHTQDGGYMDEDGFVFIVDRLKDMIVSGGENVYSAEVENALAKHPAVHMCAVIGIPDDKWGESVHAIVVLKPGAEANEDALRVHCKLLIAGYKCPRSIEYRSELPLSGAGKLLKNKLRETFWQGRERSVG